MLAPEDYVTEEERLRAEREAAFRAEAEQVSQPRCSAHLRTSALCACARAGPASAPAPHAHAGALKQIMHGTQHY